MSWSLQKTLFNTHGLLLCYISRHPCATQREMARALDISTTYATLLTRELEDAGLVKVNRTNYRNSYTIPEDACIDSPLFGSLKVSDLTACIMEKSTLAELKSQSSQKVEA